MATTPMVDLGRAELVEVTPDMQFQPGDRLGNAEFVGYFETHSQEWHDERATGYGGSDVAAIAGCSKWSTPYNLWAERTGLVERQDDGKNEEAKEWGARLEPIILEKFAENYPGLIVVRHAGTWRNVERPWHKANPDALSYAITDGTWGIVEAKTARFADDWKDDTGSWLVPAYYRTQDMWYLDAFGLLDSTFCVLFSGSDYREFPVQADPLEQRVNMRQVVEFDRLVRERIPPKFQGREIEVMTARRVHPQIVNVEVELDATGQAWLDARIEFATAESKLQAKSAAVLLAMGHAKRGMVGGKVIVAREARGAGVPYLKSKVKD